MKKYYALIIMFVAALTLVGCSTAEPAGNANQNTSLPDRNPAADAGAGGNWNGSSTPASVTDLAAGQSVMVIGTSNADGSLSANRILFGEAGADLSALGRNLPPQGSPTSDGSANTNRSAAQAEQSADGPPVDFQGSPDGFQNISPEQREQFRAARAADGGQTRSARAGGQGMARVIGEIIERTDTSLTVKLADGGSKLIFFSDATTVAKVKPPEAASVQ